MSETSGAESTDGAVRADLTAATEAAGSADAAIGNRPSQGSSAQEGRNFRKTREGLVVSDKMEKTVVVAVEDRVQHPLYHKTMRRTNKLKAHDEQNAAGVGDRVLLMETRPVSASKRWRVVEILEKAK